MTLDVHLLDRLLVPGKPAGDGLDHPAEPEVVQQVQDAVRCQVHHSQPERHTEPFKHMRDHLIGALCRGGQN